MFFVIAEMPSKTFVMVLKKLHDHFNIQKLLSMSDEVCGARADGRAGLLLCGAPLLPGRHRHPAPSNLLPVHKLI